MTSRFLLSLTCIVVSVVGGKRFAPSLDVKIVTLGYIEDNAIELASLGATKKKVCV